ncbi:MAG: hypothetical protein A3G09_01040 [Candidatus Moranbacteria bacterium RIFCSPLOWO2_12_FULL_48_12]|nr:MAG: hypothetical protein A3G09_01040 [Candidatus Moranbacteria bacterium RIFCSPLOWO2_12_FULL_48_12]
MTEYTKVYTRENSLIAFQIWEEHQCHLLKEKYGVALPSSVFDVYTGVASVWYPEDAVATWENFIVKKLKENPEFVAETMQWYGSNLDKLEEIWKKEKVENLSALEEFFKLAAESWLGLSISYFLPAMKRVSKVEQDLGMKLRERAVDFLELTNHVIQNTLRDFYPDLGRLIKYLTIEEARSGALPLVSVLEVREKHYIYYDFNVFTDVDTDFFVRLHDIDLRQEVTPQDVKELQGQIAMKGLARGKVRVLKNKSQIPELQAGEILVTAMTTPDYLPAMKKATAFITDEGGITCHAAIVARELGKPCIIGTKVATQVLKDGDMVEVDAERGIIRILKQ